MGQILKTVLGAAAVALLSVGVAEAGACKGKRCKDRFYGDEGYGFVTAQASIGGKMVTAPIRPGRWGDEVRLPGGAWVDCEITCEYTLRRHTVDFWDGMGQGRFVSPGLLRFDLDLDDGSFHRRRYR